MTRQFVPSHSKGAVRAYAVN